MENLEQNQTEMINNLIYNIRLALDLGDFKTRREIAEYVETKARLTAEDAENWGYKKAKNMADYIADRVARIRTMQKAHLIERRIQETLETIKF